MADPLPSGMTADEFLSWAEEQPGKYEFEDGEVVAMAPERISHGEAEGEIFARMRESIRSGRLPCQAFVDSVGVRVDDATIYQPDVLVRCGPSLPGDLNIVPDPLILVEVLSPSTGYRDVGRKLAGYFRIESVRHYIVVDAEKRLLIHHERQADGRIVTEIIRDGTLNLDPPGLTLANVFETLVS